jgi:hypothetical protein
MFTGKIRTEGLKGYLILAIPAALKFPEGWVRLDLPKAKPCFLYARGHERRMCIPSWNFPGLKAGNSVEARVEIAQPHRAVGERAGFDWNTFVGGDERTFATDEANGVLKLWSRYSAPFELLRCPPIEPLYRVLGFYQAEGSKGETGNDFSFANMNVELIRNVLENLAAIGVGANQLYAEILQGVGESRESAMAKYASLPLEVVAVRPRSGKGGSAYVVHAHNSKPFRGMVSRALECVATNKFPSREAALAYALGWLDGDGNITLAGPNGATIRLCLAGYEFEQRAVFRALCEHFGWPAQDFRFGGVRHHSTISLSTNAAIDLACANAFPFSMNRVRLLYAIELRRSLEHDIADTAHARTFETLAPEIQKLRQLSSPELLGRTGVKGAPYPY